MNMQMVVEETSTAPVDPLWALLIGAFGAALLTVIGGLIGAWIQAVREHRKWLRERRFEAYLDFMNGMSELSEIADIEPNLENAERIKTMAEALTRRLLSSGDAVSMLGPRAVNAAGTDWLGAATTFISDRTEANREALRRGRWQFLIAVGEELNSKNVGDTPPTARSLHQNR